MTTEIIPERLALLPKCRAKRGAHHPPDAMQPVTGCLVELVAWLRGEQGDQPPCLDSRLAGLLRACNDAPHWRNEEELTTWVMRIAPIVPTGDAGDLLDRLAVMRLRETVMPLAPSWPEEVRGEVAAAVKGVIDALEGRGGREAARLAAESAAGSALESAALAASGSAAVAAESAARSAALAARSVVRSAQFAARSAQFAARLTARETEAAEVARAAAWRSECDRITCALDHSSIPLEDS